MLHKGQLFFCTASTRITLRGSCRCPVLPDPLATTRTDGSALITARDVGLDFGATPRDEDAANGVGPANKQLHLHRVFDSANANGSSDTPNGSGHLQVRNVGPLLLQHHAPHVRLWLPVAPTIPSCLCKRHARRVLTGISASRPVRTGRHAARV